MGKIVIVVGVPGVGKTSVLENAKKYISGNYTIVNVGDIMFELAKNIYNISHRDEMRKKLTKEQNDELQRKAYEKIYEISKNYEKTIIDTHLLIETPVGFMSGINKYVSELLKPDLVIIITAEPDKIFIRRLKDQNIRARDIEGVKRIELHQNLTINYGLILSYFFGTKIEIIENPEGLLEETSKKLADIINSI